MMAQRSHTNVRQREAGRTFIKAGGVDKGSSHGHWVIKMPNGRRISLPSGILKVGLLKHEIKSAGLTEEEFLELL
jgi:hypothetical protein